MLSILIVQALVRQRYTAFVSVFGGVGWSFLRAPTCWWQFRVSPARLLPCLHLLVPLVVVLAEAGQACPDHAAAADASMRVLQ